MIETQPIVISPRTQDHIDMEKKFGLMYAPESDMVKRVKKIYSVRKSINNFGTEIENNWILQLNSTINDNALHNIVSDTEQFNKLVDDFPSRISNFRKYVEINPDVRYPEQQAQFSFLKKNLNQLINDSNNIRDQMEKWCQDNGWVIHRGKLIKNRKDSWDGRSSGSEISISDSALSESSSCLSEAEYISQPIKAISKSNWQIEMPLYKKKILSVRFKKLNTHVGFYPTLCIKPNYFGIKLNIHGGNNIKPSLLIKYDKKTFGFKKQQNQPYLILGRDFYENTTRTGITMNTCLPITCNKREFFNGCQLGFEAKTNLFKKTSFKHAEIGFQGEISAEICSINRNGVKLNRPLNKINRQNVSLRSENSKPTNVFLEQPTVSLSAEQYFQQPKIDTYNNASLMGNTIIGFLGSIVLYKTLNFIKKNFLNH